MKYLFLILIIASVEIFSQATTPSGYTTNYGYRKWAQGANPSADSLNANWDELDADIKTAYDSAQTKVNTYGTQTVNGIKTFGSGGVGIGAGRLFFNNNAQTSPLYVGELCPTASRTYLTYTNLSGTDTLATLDDIRTGSGGYATLAGAQSFTGAKTFAEKLISTDDIQYTEETIAVGDVSFSMDGATYGSLNPDDAWTVVTINGGANGKIVHLINSSATYNITLDDGGGNLQLAGDFVMSQYDAITLIYDSGISTWIELNRSNN